MNSLGSAHATGAIRLSTSASAPAAKSHSSPTCSGSKIPVRTGLEIAPPQITLDERLEVHLGGVTCVAHHAPTDHASDGVVIHVVEDELLFLGDVLWPGLYAPEPYYTAASVEAVTNRIRGFGASIAIDGHTDTCLDATALTTRLDDLINATVLVEKHGAAAVELVKDDSRELIGWCLAGAASLKCRSRPVWHSACLRRTMSELIRVAVVGAGENTRTVHIPNLQAIDGVALVAVSNRSRESSLRVSEEFGIPRVYATWREVVGDPEVDAVVIGTWPNMHCRVTVASLEADKHVLCEARLSRNAAEAHEMLRAAGLRPHLVAQVVPSPLSLRVDTTVRRLLAEGYLGEILAIDVRDRGSFLDRDSATYWRQDAELSGFNVLSLGIWYEAVMRWVGEAESVMAMGRVFVKTRKDSDGTVRAVRIPEHLDVVAQMVCGAQAHFQISSVAGLGGPPEAVLYGSDGTLRFSEDGLYGGRRGDNELIEIEIPPEEEGPWRVEQEFVGAVRGVESVRLTTFEDGVRYMEFTEAVARSSMTGTAISLPLLP